MNRAEAYPWVMTKPPPSQPSVSPSVTTVLTDGERVVLDLLAAASREFFALSEHHPSDKQEWAHEMHLLQQRVMCRVAVRAHPDYFTPMLGIDGQAARSDGSADGGRLEP